MITNILEYLVTDIYYQLWLVAYSSDNSRRIFTREDWDKTLLEQFPDPADIPDYISVDNGDRHYLNSEERFHLGRNSASVSISEMTIAWGEVRYRGTKPLIDVSRKNAPAKIVITNLKKWHHDGVLHRRRGDALIVKHATFTWGMNGCYGRDAGPYQISLKQVRAKAHLGEIEGFKNSGIASTWGTSSGRRLANIVVNDVIASNDIEVDLMQCDSVFSDATDEVIFLTEIAE